jgi:mannan endo-1,4-beta-mannosidase
MGEFIAVDGTRFVVHGKPYRYVGLNFWSATNLGSRGSGGDRARLLRELDRIRALGVTNLRILGGSEGPNDAPWRVVPALQTSLGNYDEEVLDGLDFLIAAMKARGLYAVVCLNDFWPWSGGMAQYLMWRGAPRAPYPMEPPHDWGAYRSYTTRFYSSGPAMADFRKHIEFLLGRVNPYTKVAYKDEPAIMAWQLANEPEGGGNALAMRKWIHESAAFIKSIDENHLVSTGSEGDTGFPIGNDVVRDHQSPFIDYVTFHCWVQNWNWFDPKHPDDTYAAAERKALAYVYDQLKAAARLGKPAVLEEFGMARDDGSYDPASPTTVRDRYYDRILGNVTERATHGEPLAGVNLWAWGGEGRPLAPYGGNWRPGDPLIGDPPHEPQGWYSIYDTDENTLSVIAHYAHAIATPSAEGTK